MVDRRVIGVEEHESDVSFLKLFSSTIFLDKGPFFCEKVFSLYWKEADTLSELSSYVRLQVKQTFSYNSSFSLKFDQR